MSHKWEEAMRRTWKKSSFMEKSFFAIRKFFPGANEAISKKLTRCPSLLSNLVDVGARTGCRSAAVKKCYCLSNARSTSWSPSFLSSTTWQVLFLNVPHVLEGTVEVKRTLIGPHKQALWQEINGVASSGNCKKSPQQMRVLCSFFKVHFGLLV